MLSIYALGRDVCKLLIVIWNWNFDKNENQMEKLNHFNVNGICVCVAIVVCLCLNDGEDYDVRRSPTKGHFKISMKWKKT